MASFFAGSGFHRASDFLLSAIVLIPTVCATVLIVRFARRHEKEIGEARFDTRNPEDAPGAG